MSDKKVSLLSRLTIPSTNSGSTEKEREALKKVQLAQEEHIRLLAQTDNMGLSPADFDRYRLCDDSRFEPQIYAQIQRWHPDDGFGLILSGAPGTGKTHLGKHLCTRFGGPGFRCHFIHISDLVSRLNFYRGAPQDLANEMARLAKPDLLVIDDFGQQVGWESEHDLLVRFINLRSGQNRKHTIYTTNLTGDDIKSLLPVRLTDRLLEHCVFIRFSNTSFRAEIFKKNVVKFRSKED